MRELVYFVAVSLDGFIASPQGTWEAFPMEGDHMQALIGEYTDTLPGHALQALGCKADGSRFDTVLMGWNTYAVGLLAGVTDPYPHLRQHVFTRRDVSLPAAITVSADPVATVRALKAETTGTGIWLCGGGLLASALIDEIDRLVLKVNPVLLGAGVPLFAGRRYDPRSLRLAGTRRFASGVLINEYLRA